MSFFQRIAHPFLKWLYDYRARKPYIYRYRGLELIINPGVFSPKGTITTELFADYLLEKEWEGRTILELGAGSGLISFLLAQQGANVTASDINEAAVRGLEENNQRFSNSITVVYSDLFEHLDKPFETIILNPPFFAKTPKSTTEMAWFCGENFEFFERFFKFFSARIIYMEKIIMVLSTSANIKNIISIASKYQITVKERVRLGGHREIHEVITFGHANSSGL